MTDLTLSELAKKMAGIDFSMLQTHTPSGDIAGRPMSNNGDVEYDGTSWFFAFEDSDGVRQAYANSKVSLSFSGSKSLLGKPPLFVAVEGDASVIRDRALLEEHWVDKLDRWFPQGVETPGIVLIRVAARRIHWWEGEEAGEIEPTASPVVRP